MLAHAASSVSDTLPLNLSPMATFAPGASACILSPESPIPLLPDVQSCHTTCTKICYQFLSHVFFLSHCAKALVTGLAVLILRPVYCGILIVIVTSPLLSKSPNPLFESVPLFSRFSIHFSASRSYRMHQRILP